MILKTYFAAASILFCFCVYGQKIDTNNLWVDDRLVKINTERINRNSKRIDTNTEKLYNIKAELDSLKDDMSQIKREIQRQHRLKSIKK